MNTLYIEHRLSNCWRGVKNECNPERMLVLGNAGEFSIGMVGEFMRLPSVFL